MVFGNTLAVLIITAGGICAVAIFGAGTYLRRRLTGDESDITRIIISVMGIPAVLAILAVSVFVAFRYAAEIPEIAHQVMESVYLQVIYVIIGAFILAQFIKNILDFYAKTIASRTASDFDDKVIHFFQSVYGYVIVIGATFAIFSVLKIDITPLLATGGVVGIIVGLAAQDTFGNFFSGAMIAADQPFREGDRIEIQGIIGDVISVGPRSTRIKTLDRQLVTVPNKILTENMLTNFALPDITQKVRITIGVGYNSDIAQVKSILSEVARTGISAGVVLASPAPEIYFMDFGPSALMFQMLTYTNMYDEIPRVRDYLNTGISSSFRSAGIDIPYPQMDVNLKSSPPNI